METTASSGVGETASSLAELREGFAGVSGKKIFVNFETNGWRDREALHIVAPAKAGAHNHEWLWSRMLELQLASILLPGVMGPGFRRDDKINHCSSASR